MKRSTRQSIHMTATEAAIVGRAAARAALGTPDYARMVTVKAARVELGEEEVARIELATGGGGQ